MQEKIPIGTWLMNRHGNSILYIDLKVDFPKFKISFLESAPNKHTIKGIKYMKADYCGTATDTLTD